MLEMSRASRQALKRSCSISNSSFEQNGQKPPATLLDWPQKSATSRPKVGGALRIRNPRNCSKPDVRRRDGQKPIAPGAMSGRTAASPLQEGSCGAVAAVSALRPWTRSLSECAATTGARFCASGPISNFWYSLTYCLAICAAEKRSSKRLQ